MKKFKLTPGKIALIAAVILAVVFVSIKIPRFLSLDNILNVLRQTAIVAIVSFGSAMVIIIKGIDLSVGGLIACCAMVSGLMMKAGIPKKQALALKQPFEFVQVPLFNSIGGYKSYVYPVILILIRHQTFVLGLGLMQGTRNEIKEKYCMLEQIL